jgi:glutamate N-acetyltransferase/amino-acid N-acetyltransferase
VNDSRPTDVAAHGLTTLEAVRGVRAAAVAAGIRYADRLDLVMLAFDAGTQAAAVFTRNAFCAAPVQIARDYLQRSGGQPRMLLINTGNANAGTGAQGLEAAQRCCEALAGLCGVDASEVLPFSTGVIGEDLPVGPIEAALPALVDDLAEDGWLRAAQGILTTDTRPKGASRTIEMSGLSCTLTGIAKGAGMLRPDMATMLAFVATDAPLARPALERLLETAVEQSFHRITVDGDTSTNDAVVLAATGAAGGALIAEADDPRYIAFAAALESLCVELAQGLVRDGEGASKFVEISVEGGLCSAECLDVAFTIAHSPLVKTALFASDPNWGRILAAIGRAGVAELDVDQVRILVNGVLIAENGSRAVSYTEEAGAAAMAPGDLRLEVDLGRGDCRETVWTSDFSYDYVRINAEYRS